MDCLTLSVSTLFSFAAKSEEEVKECRVTDQLSNEFAEKVDEAYAATCPSRNVARWISLSLSLSLSLFLFFPSLSLFLTLRFAIGASKWT